jgi:hypothetical protein
MSPARLTAWLAVVFGLIGLGFLLHGVDPEKLLSPFLLGWALWLLSPYALLAVTARYGRFPVVIKGSLVLMILAGLWGSLMYAELTFHFTTKADAQDAIAMVFIPALQHMAAIPLVALLFGLGAAFARRKQP